MASTSDEAVVATNDDATICKYQAVHKQYYKDPYVGHFLLARTKVSMPRKAPEINRGYYVRSTSIAYIVERFIINNPEGQIINLGAGYDSLFWRLQSKNLINDICTAQDEDNQGIKEPPKRNIKYVEVDMCEVVVAKMYKIGHCSDLRKPLGTSQTNGLELHSDNYHLIPFDLRQVDKGPLKNKLLNECKLDFNKPTLCLAECVLVYMPMHDSDSLISWLSETFDKNLTILNYEQCNMSDKFSEIMLQNMNARHCDLMGVEACKSLDSQMERFKTNGLSETKSWTMLEILRRCLLPASVERIYKLEFLDEQELLEQLLEHYCISLGSNRPIDWIPEEEYWLSVSTETA